MSSDTSEVVVLFGAALAVVVVLTAAVGLAAWAAFQARRGRREAKVLRREVLTASRNMVRILGIVVRLDPSGTLGREAEGMAASIRAAEVRIAGGVSGESATIPVPKPVELVEPLSLDDQWALDCEANDWKDGEDIPLSEGNRADAQRMAAAVHAREKRRKEKTP